MADEATISAVLTELDGIANAPMTPEQRLTRAQAVPAAHGLSVSKLVTALGQADLPWNAAKAAELKITPELWQESLATAEVSAVAGLSELLDALHRAESAAIMLRAGYKAAKDDGGNLRWTH